MSTTATPRTGRPPIGNERAKGRSFRLTDETMAQIQALAEAWSCNNTDAIRRAVVDSLAALAALRCTDCSAVMLEGAEGWDVDVIVGEGKRARCPLHSTAGRMRRAATTTRTTTNEGR